MLPKKEVMKHLGEIEKLEKYLGGVKDMKKLPGALFIVDTRKERNAIAEAHKLGIPVVAIADTNCDPDEIDYVIPGNDDAIRAIKLISSIMANAVLEGKQGEQMEDAAEGPSPPSNFQAPAGRGGRPSRYLNYMEEYENGIYCCRCEDPARDDRRGHDGLQEGPGRL